MLTARHKTIVEDTLLAISPVFGLAALMFYKRLSDIAPALRPLLPRPIGEQGRRLMQALALAVSSLERPEALAVPLRSLGAPHAGYGVRNEHYSLVAEALLWTLEHAPGSRFDAAARAAWTSLLSGLAARMKHGERPGEQPWVA